MKNIEFELKCLEFELKFLEFELKNIEFELKFRWSLFIVVFTFNCTVHTRITVKGGVRVNMSNCLKLLSFCLINTINLPTKFDWHSMIVRISCFYIRYLNLLPKTN